jgi:Pyruvate/2-oxoacid:ferredoxin oxidoreductase delta subunit/flavodoxin
MNYNTINIFYFSGTGNAKQVASWFSELAIEKNIDCRLFNIEEKDVNSINIENSQNLIVIIAPIHGFNFPKIMLNFIRKFPEGKNRIVLMSTRGGLKIGNIITPGVTGVAFMWSSIILKKKGYKIVGQIPFDMPSNWISIHPALRKKSVDFIIEKNRSRTKKHFEKLCADKTNFAARKDIIQDAITSLLSFLYLFGGRYFFAKSYYASHKCTHCNLCEKQCPVKAIKTVNQRPCWTFKCESCMKCMNNCPVNAIETTHGLWIFVFLISLIAVPLFYDVLPNFPRHWSVVFLIYNVFWIGSIVLLYNVQHILLKNRVFAKIISFASLTYYKFWGRYNIDFKFKKDAK